MDFGLNGDQQLLQDSVARYLSKEYSFLQRARIMASGGYSERVWKDFASFGWLALPFAEEMGGLGGSPVDTAILMEGFGRHLVLEPYLWSIVVGGTILAHGAPSGQRAELLGALMAGDLHLALAGVEKQANFAHIGTRAMPSGHGFQLQGEKPVVPNGTLANKFLVCARTSGSDGDTSGLTLFLVDRHAPGLEQHAYRMNDGTTASALRLNKVVVGADDVIGELDNAYGLLERATDHGIAAVCAEAVGSATYLIETTGAYLKTREQFGRALAGFQSLQHRIAEMYVAKELSRSMTQVAARSLHLPDDRRRHAISAARIQVARATKFVAQQAVQLHGGMGVSEELDVTHHFKRIAMIPAMFGDEGQHLDRFVRFSPAEESAVRRFAASSGAAASTVKIENMQGR
jgi:alkylation response protein AidB-like acyl-CoA dehydrogenase